MKKIFVCFFTLVVALTTTLSISATQWSSKETLNVPAWGAWSERTKTSTKKNKACDYGYIHLYSNNTGWTTYGDFYFHGERRSNSYYSLAEGYDKRIYYLNGYKSKDWWIGARVSSSNVNFGGQFSINFKPTN